MKKHYNLGLLIILIGLLLTGCQYTYKPIPKKAINLEDNTTFKTAKKSLKFIQDSKPDSFKSLLSRKLLNIAKSEQIDGLMREGKIIIDNSEYPNDTNVLISQNKKYSFGGEQMIETFSFPFQSNIYKDSIMYFHITILNDEIYKYVMNEYPPGIRIIEPKHSETHIQDVKMNADNISWFRIWYNGGKYNNKRYNFLSNGFFAVSGDGKVLEETGIKDKIHKLFNSINEADFDSLDFKFFEEDEKGDPEYIKLRVRFDNEEYSKLGEFEVYCFLQEEEGIKEIMSDYIIFKHTSKTRYLMLKDNNQEILNIITEIAHFDYDGYYESDP